MKTIGFVDYYISEWHAINYPGWMDEVCEKRGYDYKVKYGWALKDVSDYDGKTTAEWCKEFGVTQCATAQELCEKSDYIVILAPSDPDKHLPLAESVFPYAKGKRIYIDKTFAPDLATAKKIYELADKYGITFFSTSALRYADELEGYTGCDNASFTGGGSNFDEYIIHQVEMLVKTMGTDFTGVTTEKTDNGYRVAVTFKGGKTGVLNYSPDYGFSMEAEKAGEKVKKDIVSDFFKTLIEKILIFFECGEVDFGKEQTLAVMAIREAAIKDRK